LLEIVSIIPHNKKSFCKIVNIERINHYNDSYIEFVRWITKNNRWDIGIIPLEANKFNKNKSYIKYLDYTALGLPVICSDIEPYKGVVENDINGLVVENDSESWYEAIDRLIKDPYLRKRLSDMAFNDLTKKYILKHRAKDFIEVYKKLG